MCETSPGDPGCTCVGNMYEININGKQVQILVDHTNQIEKHQTLSQKEREEDSSEDEPEAFGDVLQRQGKKQQ